MKKIAMVVLLVLCSCVSNSLMAQNKFASLIQRIAQLQVYLDYVKKGYNIVRDGLGTINKIKNGEFGLHDAYFKSLKNVSPAVRKYERVSQTFDLQGKILAAAETASRQAGKCGQFSASELSYMSKVYSNLASETEKDIKLLTHIITGGDLGMKDADRLKAIDKLFLTVQDKYQFLLGFNRDMRTLAIHRIRERGNLEVSKKLNNLN
jgi:uncharacterized phage infection (PIP) family protein YhgE